MQAAFVMVTMPGADRKRSAHLYRLSLVFRGGPHEECKQLWFVAGGRDEYQVTLDGSGQWECTCAAKSYSKTGGPCKHIRAVAAFSARRQYTPETPI